MKSFYVKSLMAGIALCMMAGPGFAASAYTPQKTTPTINNQPVDSYNGQTSYGGSTTTTTTTVSPVSSAQNALPNSNRQQIGSCLCMHQDNQSLQGNLTAKQNAYDQAIAERATLTQQMSNERAAGASAVDQVRATSEKLIQLQNQINDQYIPQLQDATNRYNSGVGQYQQSCAGKVFDADVEAQVQSTLQCRG